MREPAGPRPEVAPVLELLRRRVGLSYPDNRQGEVAAAIRRRMRAAGLTDARRYVQLLARDEAAMTRLVTDCTVGETYFFREPEQLAFIRREVLPEIRDRRRGEPVRVWSAGCASGEEAYSLAILLRESGLGEQAVVVGTDASRVRLARARQGRYTAWSLRGVADATVDRYFLKRGKQFELSPRVRSAVQFRELNLAADGYPSSKSGIWRMDLVLCRNVLIYLDREAIPGVASRLYRALSPGGWLFLAAADPSLGSMAPFETVVTDRGIAFRRPLAAAEVRPPHNPVPPLRHGKAQRRADPSGPTADSGAAVPAAAATRRRVETTHRGYESDRVVRDAARVRQLANRGRLSEAGVACAAALERDPGSAELLYLHSVLLAQAGHYQEAASSARRALYLHGDLAVAHLGLGAALGRLGDEDGARRSFRNAVRALAAMEPGAPVPESGGQTAASLLDLARAQLRLLDARRT